MQQRHPIYSAWHIGVGSGTTESDRALALYSLLLSLSPTILLKFNEVSGNIINYGSDGGSGVMTGGNRRQPSPLGNGRAIFFDGVDDILTFAAASVPATRALTTQRWAFLLDAHGLGESNGGAFFYYNDSFNLRFINTGAIGLFIPSSGVTLIASTNVGQFTGLNQWCWLFVDYDNDGTRKGRLWQGIDGVLSQLTLATDRAMTGTMTTPSDDLPIGNNAIGNRTQNGPFALTFAGAGLWTTALMQQIINTVPIPVEPLRVFFGDSVTVGGLDTQTANRWVNLVAAAKGWSHWRNEGISSTPLQNSVQNKVAVIGGAVTNNGRDTYAARALAGNPSVVLILYGLNDLRLNDVGFTVANFQNDLGEVVDGLIAGGVLASNIIIGSPSHMTRYTDYSPWNGGSAALHSQYRDACAAVAAAKSTRYIDVYQWMLDNGGDTLVDADGVHPNDAGHAAIAAAFLTVL